MNYNKSFLKIIKINFLLILFLIILSSSVLSLSNRYGQFPSRYYYPDNNLILDTYNIYLNSLAQITADNYTYYKISSDFSIPSGDFDFNAYDISYLINDITGDNKNEIIYYTNNNKLKVTGIYNNLWVDYGSIDIDSSSTYQSFTSTYGDDKNKIIVILNTTQFYSNFSFNVYENYNNDSIYKSCSINFTNQRYLRDSPLCMKKGEQYCFIRYRDSSDSDIMNITVINPNDCSIVDSYQINASYDFGGIPSFGISDIGISTLYYDITGAMDNVILYTFSNYKGLFFIDFNIDDENLSIADRYFDNGYTLLGSIMSHLKIHNADDYTYPELIVFRGVWEVYNPYFETLLYSKPASTKASMFFVDIDDDGYQDFCYADIDSDILSMECYKKYGLSHDVTIIDYEIPENESINFSLRSSMPGVILDFNNDGNYDICFNGYCIDIETGEILFNIYNNDYYNYTGSYDDMITEFGDINDDGVLDMILGMRNNGTLHVYLSDYTNCIPTRNGIAINPGNPLCVGETVTITSFITDCESEDNYYVKYKCYDDDTYKITNDTDKTVSFNCTYNETDYYDITYQISDEYHYPFFYGDYSRTIIVANVEGCYYTNDTILIIDEDEADGGATAETDDDIEFWENVGLNTTLRRIAFGFVMMILANILFFVCLGFTDDFDFGANIKTFFALLLNAFLFVIAVYTGLFPISLLFFMLLIIGLLVMLILFYK